MKMKFIENNSKDKIKNIVLKTISGIMLFMLFFGICTIDSIGIGYTISILMIVVSLLWLIPFGIVNGIIRL